MNKKEVNEIRKNFDIDSNFMTINKINTMYVTADKSIAYNKTEYPMAMDNEYFALIIAKLKQTLKGKMGKSLIELNFNKHCNSYNIMSNIYYKSEFDNNIDEYIEYVVDNYDYVGAYVLFTAQCTYTVIKKKSECIDEEDALDTIDYNFIISCVCPVNLEFKGIICTEDSIIEKETNLTKIVEDSIQGWLYPTFSDRLPETNSILYSAKSTKLVDKSFIFNVLGCSYENNSDEQKKLFNEILTDSIGNNLTYNDVNTINDKILSKLEESISVTEPLELTKNDIIDIMEDVGFEDDTIDNVTSVMNNKLEDNQTFNANAIVSSKNTIESNGFKLTYDKSYSDKVKIKSENGHRYVMFEADDFIDLNGISVKN